MEFFNNFDNKIFTNFDYTLLRANKSRNIIIKIPKLQITKRTGWGKRPSSRRDPSLRTRRTPRWRKRTTAASRRGSWRTRWWGNRTRYRYQHLNQQHRQWLLLHQWTWLLNRYLCSDWLLRLFCIQQVTREWSFSTGMKKCWIFMMMVF